MEPEQTPEVVLNEKEASVWNTVTPLSKYLAMILFVALPFIGGYVGYKYSQNNIVEVKEIVVEKEESKEPLSFLIEKFECQKVGEVEHLQTLEKIEEAMRTSNINAFVSFGPEYTYNAELDTCLYFVGVTSNFIERGESAYNPSNTDYNLLLIVKDLLSGEDILFFSGDASKPQHTNAIAEFDQNKQALFNK